MRALLVLACFACFACLAGSAHAQVLRVGDRAVELDTAVDANGKSFELAAYRGRWVVIAIGAQWCDPCRAELPVLDRFAGQFSAVFMALSIDNDVADGKAFHTGLKLTRLVRVYMPEERSAVAGRYGAAKMPSTFVIDPTGVVRVVLDGFDPRTLAASTMKLRAGLASVLPPLTPKPAPAKPPSPAKPLAPQPAQLPPAMPVKQLVSAVPPIVWPDAPHVTWWSETWNVRL